MRKGMRIWLPVIMIGMTILACSMPGSISNEDKVRTQIAETQEIVPSNTLLVFASTDVVLTPTVTPEQTRTETPIPSPTFTIVVIPSRTLQPSITQTSQPCDVATFMDDITVPDGTVFSPGASFVKTWLLKNVGTCTWTTEYEIFFESGEHMGGPADLNLTKNVLPGESVQISVSLTAPATPGTYRGNWKFHNAKGDVFGLTSGGPFYVEIVVKAP